MSLADFRFLIFFGIIYILLWGIKGIERLYRRQNSIAAQRVLLVASYIFVAIADWHFCLWIFAMTLISYVAAIQIAHAAETGKAKRKKIWFVFSVVSAIFMLVVLKYFNFLTTSLCSWIGITSVPIRFIMPIGISFYTFSALSYVIDVYREKYMACNKFEEFALYISFFPKLVSGPIVRANEFLTQLRETRGVSLKNLEVGIQIFVLGLFKKIVLADHLGVFVDEVFSFPNAFDGITCMLAIVSYSLQIYFDFSGYSDLAIGVAKMCGYDFEKNFNLPYISKNLSEFWKRWHISLSSWLQEYLYYSLGGNRKGPIRTYINLFLTMLIGGLWHGANWTFVVWGAFHGIGLIAHKLFLKWKKNVRSAHNNTGLVSKGISIVMTFFVVTLGWVFFRADSLSNAITMFVQIFSLNEGIRHIYSWSIFSIVLLTVMTMVAAYTSKKKGLGRIEGGYTTFDLTRIEALILFFVFCGLTIGMGYYGDTAFIYGKF